MMNEEVALKSGPLVIEVEWDLSDKNDSRIVYHSLLSLSRALLGCWVSPSHTVQVASARKSVTKK